MAKRDTAAEITALNGSALDESQYTQKELDALLTAAEKGPDGQGEYDALKAEYDADGAPATPDAELLPGQPVEYTHSDGRQYPGKIIRVNDAETGDVAISVDALGAESRQMTVLKGSWKLID